MRESWTYQAILEEGKAIGREMARAEAYRGGRVERSHRILIRLVRKRFGRLSRTLQSKEIEAIHDMERLDKMLDRLLVVSSWDELFGD
jgi:hypothetical protein